jgi:hypothetical protein
VQDHVQSNRSSFPRPSLRQEPEPPPSGVQRCGGIPPMGCVNVEQQRLQSDDGDEAPPSGVIRGDHEQEEAPPSGVVRGGDRAPRYR